MRMAVRASSIVIALYGMVASLATDARAQGADYVRAHFTKYEYRIPMRDGIRLSTSVYVPKDAGPTKRYPILLTRTPYGVAPYGVDAYPENLGPSEPAAKEGFIFAYQDVRGRFMSDGVFEDVRPYNPRKGPREVDEASDAFDTIDWLVKHAPWNSGKVGMWGISYPGFYTAMGVIDAHPALVAASPQAPIADWFVGDDFHHNGALFLPHAFNFFVTLRQAAPGADEGTSAALRPRHHRRVPLLPRNGADAELRARSTSRARWPSGSRPWPMRPTTRSGRPETRVRTSRA